MDKKHSQSFVNFVQDGSTTKPPQG